MNDTELNMIPIDGKIEDFRNHLINNTRTILSARFGDGKSVLLNHAIAASAEDTTYIVVHPVHYQVSDNKDIFELVKRDILFQMIGQGMIAEDYEITEDIILSFYLQHNTTDIAKNLLSSLFEVAPNIASASPVANCLGGFGGIAVSSVISGINRLRTGYKSFKDKLSSNTDDRVLEYFFQNTDKLKNSPIESDAITAIIRENIKKWKEKENKRVVLVFEDMDRLDPAHLFRIMNVLSAQIDANCTIDEHEIGKMENRFGVDNVVLVLDYNNLKSIFHHFYGQDTCFEGYIHKFAPKEYFRYSFKDERHSYLMERLCQATGLTIDVLTQLEITYPENPKETLASIFEATDLRKIIHSMEGLQNGIKPEARYGGTILSEGLLKLIIFLRRLIGDEVKIASLLKPLIIPQTSLEGIRSEYLRLFKLSIRDISPNKAENPTVFIRGKNNQLYNIKADLHPNDQVRLARSLIYNREDIEVITPETLIDILFKYIYANGSR